MWIISKDFTFEAAHKLPDHQGKCSRLHGHSFKLTVYVASDRLISSGSSAGMVEDFGDISKVVKPLIEEKLDHYYLNESTGIENPTSEKLAKWIYEQLIGRVPDLYAIELAETCTCRCLYAPGGGDFLLNSR